jgi:FeS assembly SUF system protein
MSIDTSALGVAWDKEKGTVEPIEAKGPEPKPTAPTTERTAEAIHADAIAVLKGCYDPEIPVDIYELGLIYEVIAEPAGFLDVKMTLTSPMCPVAGSLPPEVKYKLSRIEGVSRVDLDLVWEPPWDPSRMSEAAKLTLNMS